jgi:hypothetical protein
MAPKRKEDTKMVVPSTPVILVSVAVFAIRLAVDWDLGGMAYSPKPARLLSEDIAKRSDAEELKKLPSHGSSGSRRITEHGNRGPIESPLTAQG